MPTSTVPPYKEENIYICDIVDLPPDDDDVKVGRALKRHTFFDLRGEMDITVTDIQDPDGTPIVAAVVAVAVATPASGVAPLVITFDGSGSTGPIIEFLWELDIDAGGYNAISTLETSNFEAVLAGTYTLRLTVTHFDGTTTSVDSATPIVVSAAPV